MKDNQMTHKLPLDYVIIDATSNDIEDINRIYKQYFPVDENYSSNLSKRMREDENIVLIVKNTYGEVIGFTDNTIEREDQNLWRNYFAVDQKYRRRGIGKVMLLQTAIDAKDQGLVTMTGAPYKKTGAPEYYERLGFKKEGNIFMSVKIDSLITTLESKLK